MKPTSKSSQSVGLALPPANNDAKKGYHLWMQGYVTATTHLTALGGHDIIMVGIFPSTRGHNGAVDVIAAVVRKYGLGGKHGLEFTLPVAGGHTISLGFCDTNMSVDVAPDCKYLQLCIGDPQVRMPWHPYYDDEWSRACGQPKIDALSSFGVSAHDETKCMRFGCTADGCKTCSRCEVMRYCSEECSAHAWLKQGHKRDCKKGHQVTPAWMHGDEYDEECSTTEPLEEDPRM
jgi:hypothetical protein